VEAGSRTPLSGGHALAGVLCAAAITECFYGADAEGKSLEAIAEPLSSCAEQSSHY